MSGSRRPPAGGAPRDGRDGDWHRDGLHFACTGCGACCRGEGYVWVTEAQAERIAGFLGLSLEAFGSRFLRRVDGRLALVDGDDDACVFWRDRCTVYPVRPRQCRTFPFWREHLASPKAWCRVAGECEGIGSGAHYGREEIEDLAGGRGETRPPDD